MIAVPVTTLAGHIAALQHAGAVAIWPLDDPTISAGGFFRELSGHNWGLQSIGGQAAAAAGPYPDATAYRLTVVADDLYNQNPSSSWPSSFGQPALTVCAWYFFPSGVPDSYLNPRIGWVPANDRLAWDAGWNPGAASLTVVWGPAASSTSPINLSGQARSLLEGNWTHLTVVMDTTVVRLYVNGSLLGTGPLSPPPGTARPLNFRVFANGGGLGGPSMQALALFDRALTDQEVASLHYEPPAPPPAAGVKVWDGTQWVEGAAKGWDGSQWSPARVWTGEDWR